MGLVPVLDKAMVSIFLALNIYSQTRKLLIIIWLWRGTINVSFCLMQSLPWFVQFYGNWIGHCLSRHRPSIGGKSAQGLIRIVPIFISFMDPLFTRLYTDRQTGPILLPRLLARVDVISAFYLKISRSKMGVTSFFSPTFFECSYTDFTSTHVQVKSPHYIYWHGR